MCSVFHLKVKKKQELLRIETGFSKRTKKYRSARFFIVFDLLTVFLLFFCLRQSRWMFSTDLSTEIIELRVRQVKTTRHSSSKPAGCRNREAVPWTRRPYTCTRPSARTTVYRRRRRPCENPVPPAARHRSAAVLGPAVRPATRCSPPSPHSVPCRRRRPTTGSSATFTVARYTRRDAGSPCTNRWPRRPSKIAGTRRRRRRSLSSSPCLRRCRTARAAARPRVTSGS